MTPGPATIPPVPPGPARPLWSVMIPTYHCAAYLREALESVLSQAPGAGAMQIEVVDDGSTEDDPEAVTREVGGGRVAFHRQPRNVGHVRNFETCLLRSRGRLVHLLHGDDRVLPGFYAAMERPFRERPDVGAAFCRSVFMNERGQWVTFSERERDSPGVVPGWVEAIATRQRLQTPAVVVRRAVYEHVGGFDPRLAWAEDWEMWVRIAASYPVWHEPAVLAEYRMHAGSSTGRNVRSGENVRDTRRAIDLMRACLPERDARRLGDGARAWCGSQAVEMAKRAVRRRDWPTAAVQLREGWKTAPSLAQAARTARFLAWAGGRALRPSADERYLTTLDV